MATTADIDASERGSQAPVLKYMNSPPLATSTKPSEQNEVDLRALLNLVQ